ncbi:hypothetical protein N7539_005061 [Penicillium diatomitis]|uniref:Uncharacterized protein n=1 Tax=Penicillium diatomitis TaxID=2819901 RepID=A0A9W9X5Z1_9EURO|nr:uncharacterized protein N7539_005061 [Penicillium diatomitis]KAJ5485073.1 hypothetical protein N7539_005061 [Penicillium diatomitis]
MEISPSISAPAISPLHMSTDSSLAAVASPFLQSRFRSRQQKKMSITQTYYLAHTARKKLTREASRADHDLRLLVGHANLLDSLMIDLADAEREQERWFNQTVNGAAKTSTRENKSRHIQWASTVVEEPEEDETEDWDPEDASDLDSDLSDSDEEDDSDFDENDFVITTPVRLRSPPPASISSQQHLATATGPAFLDDEGEETDSDFEYDDAEDLNELTLTRSPSRQSPPELLADDDSSEDESMPPSPLQPTLESFDAKESTAEAIALTDDHRYESGFYNPREQSTIVEAY